MATVTSSPKLYLLDANVLVDAERDYYSMDQVPEFWDWLVDRGRRGLVKIPAQIYDEITAGSGELPDWIKKAKVKRALLLDEEPDPALVREVLSEGYAPDLNDAEVESLGADPFLIAYGLADVENRRVVTGENSAPSKQRANRKVPDVCDDLGVERRWKYELTSDLRFSTRWRGTS